LDRSSRGRKRPHSGLKNSQIKNRAVNKGGESGPKCLGNVACWGVGIESGEKGSKNKNPKPNHVSHVETQGGRRNKNNGIPQTDKPQQNVEP